MGFISKSTFRVVLTVPATLHAPVVNTAPRTLTPSSTTHSTQHTRVTYMRNYTTATYSRPRQMEKDEPDHKRKRKRPRTHGVKGKMIRSPYLVHANSLRRQPIIFSEGHANKCISAKRRAPKGREEVSGADMRGGLRPGLELRCH
jgi:hypothetical protein